MMQLRNLARLLLLILGLFVLVGCAGIGATGNTRRDTAAAQQFFPTLSGYNVYETESMQQAFSGITGGAAVLANPAFGLLVERVDSMISCYRNVGALDANIYIQQVSLQNVTIPNAGVLAIVNEDRVRSNFLNCVTSSPLSGMMRSQSAQPEPCTGSGTFTAANGDRISYIYAATNTPVCDLFQRHFAQFG